MKKDGIIIIGLLTIVIVSITIEVVLNLFFDFYTTAALYTGLISFAILAFYIMLTHNDRLPREEPPKK
jgi:hypothetical protein